jgi:hypothetical protein
MKNKTFKNFISALKDDRNATLNSEEKASLRTSMFQNLGIDPNINTGAPNIMPNHALNSAPIRSPFATRWETFFMSTRIRVMVTAVLIFVLGSGGIAFAAEKSLPGDILYPIKTKVNENVIRAVKSVSPSAKANYEIELLDKRLKEAETVEKNEAIKNASVAPISTHASATVSTKTTRQKQDRKQSDEIKTEVIVQSIRAQQAIKVRKTDSDAALHKVLESHKDLIRKWQDDTSDEDIDNVDNDKINNLNNQDRQEKLQEKQGATSRKSHKNGKN